MPPLWCCRFQQTRVYPYLLGAGSGRPNPKMGAADPENPLFLGFSVQKESEPIFGWRGSDEALFSENKGVFSEKGGWIQWMRGLVRTSTAKAIQWRGPGHSVNRRTPKTEKLLSKSTSPKTEKLLSKSTSQKSAAKRGGCGRQKGIGKKSDQKVTKLRWPDSRESIHRVATPPAPYRSLPGPPGPESRKSLPGPSGPGVQKVSETVSKQSPESRNRLFWDSGDCFETVSDTFWTPGPEGPGRLFRDSFGVPGPEGPGDSCKGRAGLQSQRRFAWIIFRSQEKGVLAKGVSAESSVTPKETRNTQGYWAQQVHWALGAPHPREAYIFAKTPF